MKTHEWGFGWFWNGTKIPFIYGKMVFMNGTAEIDKAGRLVVPKKVRDALHVRAGDRFRVEKRGDEIVLSRDLEPTLVKRDGLWVISGGPPADYDVVEMVREDRERRMRYVAGLSDEP
jgi:AbrB family looped-hinge helix DNA binding protein